MKRITNRNNDPCTACVYKPSLKDSCSSKGICLERKCYDRLLQYENLCIEPEEIMKYIKFKNYFDTLYGQGLEIANWHLNGEMESFDNFFDAAVDGLCIVRVETSHRKSGTSWRTYT